MDVADFTAVKQLIHAHGNEVDTVALHDRIISSVNEPFFKHGGMADPQITSTVTCCFKDLWDIHPERRTKDHYLYRVLGLAAQWHQLAKMLPNGGSKALYEFNTALVMSSLIGAFGSAQTP